MTIYEKLKTELNSRNSENFSTFIPGIAGLKKKYFFVDFYTQSFNFFIDISYFYYLFFIYFFIFYFSFFIFHFNFCLIFVFLFFCSAFFYFLFRIIFIIFKPLGSFSIFPNIAYFALSYNIILASF